MSIEKAIDDSYSLLPDIFVLHIAVLVLHLIRHFKPVFLQGKALAIDPIDPNP
jgi:hypothetical protein